MKLAIVAALLGLTAVAQAAPVERRLYSKSVEASSFLWNDWNKFVENYHQNYIADDDAATAWVEGVAGTGAGEWVRLATTKLDQTTQVRLQVRSGYQKSAALFKANARPKEIVVKLLPSNATQTVTLTDTEGWQTVTITQPSGALEGVELTVKSVYAGARYEDLCISDVQVFATSAEQENPALEKANFKALLAWRAARVAAAKTFTAKTVELPTYPAYVATDKETTGFDEYQVAAVLAGASKDPGFKEWKDALAIAATVTTGKETLSRAQLAPSTKQKLVEVDGLSIPTLDLISGAYFDSGVLRLPMLGTVASLFADQLRVLDVKGTQTATEWAAGTTKCKQDSAWVLRAPASAEAKGPPAVRALVFGRCGTIEEREGKVSVRELEVLVYNADGRLALVASRNHLEGYRWTVDAGKPMLAGGRSLLDSSVTEVVARTAIAAK